MEPWNTFMKECPIWDEADVANTLLKQYHEWLIENDTKFRDIQADIKAAIKHYGIYGNVDLINGLGLAADIAGPNGGDFIAPAWRKKGEWRLDDTDK